MILWYNRGNVKALRYTTIQRHDPQEKTVNDSIVPPLKRCSKCKQEKPATLEYFGSNNENLYSQCRVCANAIARERRNAKRKAERDLLPPKEVLPDGFRRCKECAKISEIANFRPYSFECIECSRKRSREYQKNRRLDPELHQIELEKKRIKRDELRGGPPRKLLSVEESKQRKRESGRRSDQKPARKANRCLISSRRRARERKLPSGFTSNDWKRALRYFDGCCAVCGSPTGLWHTIVADHWIPLSSVDCPGTIPTNIVPLCHSMKDGEGSCNLSKLWKDPKQWLIDRYGKRKAKSILERIETYFEWVKSCV